MLQKIGFTLLFAMAALSTPSYSMMSHALRQGITVEYELPPNDPQLFINYMFWSLEANCKITSEDGVVELFAEGIAKKGKINGVVISVGQTMLLGVHTGDSLKINADSGAKVQVTNLSNHKALATCIS